MGQKRPWTRKELLAWGLPGALIPGLMVALALGWRPPDFLLANYMKSGYLFPGSGTVSLVEDGDTFRMQGGTDVRLLGIDAPPLNDKGGKEATQALFSLVDHKTVYLEYDRYQDDKYGRLLAWVWVGCEKPPVFFRADYMHLSKNASRPGLMENPEGCTQGKLVNEELVQQKLAKPVFYEDRGELKYQKRIMNSK